MLIGLIISFPKLHRYKLESCEFICFVELYHENEIHQDN